MPGLATVFVAACGPALPLETPPQSIPVRQALRNGSVEFLVQRRYPAERPVRIEIAVRAESGVIRGPVSGRVLTAGYEGQRPVRELGESEAAVVTAAPGESRATSVTWDGRDETGNVLPPGTYVVVLDFVSVDDDGRGLTEPVGVTIELVLGP